MAEWWEDHDTVVAVARRAVQEGELDTIENVLDYFEKPWHWPELVEAFLSSFGASPAEVEAWREEGRPGFLPSAELDAAGLEQYDVNPDSPEEGSDFRPRLRLLRTPVTLDD